MEVYQFYREQKIACSISEAWEFISKPANLKLITPNYMGFDITSKYQQDKMYAGQIISYVVKPMLKIPTKWVTEITHVKENEYFVDEQRVGPYSIWHHEHFIVKIDGGVLMKDLLTYKPPFGIFGRIANYLFIEKKINQIFDYRESKLNDIFGKIK